MAFKSSELASRSPNRQTNLDFFSRLIGEMSKTRFTSVTDRFIAELSKSALMREVKVESLVRSMRFLHLSIYPMEALEETAEVRFENNLVFARLRGVFLWCSQS